MPWRDLLSLAQRTQLLALPTSLPDLEEFYTLTPTDREFVAARRTPTNRLGIAVQLCFLRHPGRAWIPKEALPMGLLRYIASQIEVTTNNFESYADRDETRREHLADLLVELGLRTLGSCDYCWPKDTGLGRRKLRPLGVRRSSLFQRVLSVQFLTIREAPPYHRDSLWTGLALRGWESLSWRAIRGVVWLVPCRCLNSFRAPPVSGEISPALIGAS
jgi:hypothetical protein